MKRNGDHFGVGDHFGGCTRSRVTVNMYFMIFPDPCSVYRSIHGSSDAPSRPCKITLIPLCLTFLRLQCGRFDSGLSIAYSSGINGERRPFVVLFSCKAFFYYKVAQMHGQRNIFILLLSLTHQWMICLGSGGRQKQNVKCLP